MTTNKDVIDKIRASFVALAQEKSDLYHPSDVERVKTQDWTIERFVLTTKSEDTALKALDKAMQWRKTYGVNDFTDDYFPEEIYKIGLFSQFCKDKEGRPVLWLQAKCYHKSAELSEMIRQFSVYQFEKLDRETTHGGWGFVNDTTGAGLSNVEVDYNNFNTEVLQSYYPRGNKYILVVDLPFILSTTAKIIMTFMNEELKNSVKFINKEELAQYISADNIPVHLNGRYNTEIITIPPGVKPLKELSRVKFSGDEIEKIYSTFKTELK